MIGDIHWSMLIYSNELTYYKVPNTGGANFNYFLSMLNQCDAERLDSILFLSRFKFFPRVYFPEV